MKSLTDCDVIAIASDEQAYISDFIHHYIYLGFSNIFIGINNTTDRTNDILELIKKKYSKIHIVDVNNSHKFGNQNQSYRQLFEIAQATTSSSYCLFVDIDEFWVAPPFATTVKSFLTNKPAFDCFSFQWVNCFTEKPFTYPLSPSPRKINSHVKSMISYDSDPIELRCHAPILRSRPTIRTFVGNSTNNNYTTQEDQIIIDQKTGDPSIYQSKSNHSGFIFHRIQRSEIEYAYRLFKPHANEINSGKHFKSNRNGYQNLSSITYSKDFFSKILPCKELERYHESIRNFNLECNTLELIITARKSMCEEVVWEKLLAASQQTISREYSTMVKIFAGTRFHSWILKTLKTNKYIE